MAKLLRVLLNKMSIESDFAEIKYEDVTSFSSIDSPSLSNFNQWLVDQERGVCPEIVLALAGSDGESGFLYDILSPKGKNWGEMELWVRAPEAVEREVFPDAHTAVNLFWYKRRINNFGETIPKGVGRAAVCTAIDMTKAVDPDTEFYIDSVTSAGRKVVHELEAAGILNIKRKFRMGKEGLYAGYASI